jgi:hypothetical protein
VLEKFLVFAQDFLAELGVVGWTLPLPQRIPEVSGFTGLSGAFLDTSSF